MIKAVMFDWGGTLMESYDYPGPMVTWPEVAMIAGVDRALRRLKGKYTLVVATNAGDSDSNLVSEALDMVGLARYFEAVYAAKDLGSAKPDPQFFAQVLKETGFEPREVIMVGDSYTDDMMGGKRAGLWTVWFFSGDRPVPVHADRYCDRIITDLEKLPEAVESIRERAK